MNCGNEQRNQLYSSGSYQNEHGDGTRGYQNQNGSENMNNIKERRMNRDSENSITRKENRRNSVHQRTEDRNISSGQGHEERTPSAEDELRGQRGICGTDMDLYNTQPDLTRNNDVECPKMAMVSLELEYKI